MSHAYENFLRFQEVAEKIRAKDNYYERINAYKAAKSEAEKEQIFQELPAEAKMTLLYKDFVLREIVGAKKKLTEMKNKIRAQERLIDMYRNQGAEADKINQAYAIKKKLHIQFEELMDGSPEAYYLECAKRLEEAKTTIDSGGNIIETPYVKAKLDLIDSFNGRPTFIHGELGSGKTELAKHACRKKYGETYADSELWLEEWEKRNPRPSDPKEAEKWHEEGRKQAAEPLLISGHKNIDISDFFGSKEMSAQEALPPEKLAAMIEDTVRKVSAEREARGEKLSAAEEQDIRDIGKEQTKNPVVVKTVIGLFYKAMQEGRPIIIDELNAIPHTALIAINDLLTLKPGAKVTPLMPGIKPFRVAEGFRVFGTGNWKPEDGKAYFGRQGLDAAFLSRFAVVDYDYLPQRTTGLTATQDRKIEQKEKEENELYDIMVASLLEKNLGLRAPRGTLEKLEALATSARIIQNIFSEKEEGEVEFDWRTRNKKLKQKDVLRENVLSIRHLIPILKNWKRDGFRYQLEDYILKDYLERSQSAHPSEKLLIYGILQNAQGGRLFRTEDGWPEYSLVDEKKERAVLDLSAGAKMFGHSKDSALEKSETIMDASIETEYIPPKKIVEKVFGRFPARRKVSPRIFPEKDEMASTVSLEVLRELEAKENEAKQGLRKILEGGYKFNKMDKETIESLKKMGLV